MRVFRPEIVTALTAAALLLCGCGEDEITPDTTQHGHAVRGTIMIGDTLRSYRLHLPVASDTSDADLPLLVAVHSSHSSGNAFAGVSGFDEFADDYGFFVVFPDAIAADWAEGCNCSQADMAGVNDTGFVRSLIQKVDDEYAVDRSRVYAAGYSAGGLFTWRLACEMSDEFAAVASVVGPMSFPMRQICDPSVPVAVLNIQGTADAVFPYEGGGQGVEAVLGASETVEWWANISNCTDTEASRPPDRFDDGTYLNVVRHRPCDAGTEATLISVTGGVHRWRISAEFNTTQTIGAFLLEHGR